MKTFTLILSMLICTSLAAEDRIAVRGEGKINVSPNAAICRFGVEVKNKEAVIAQNENAKIVAKVIKELKSKYKIADKDIVTTSFRVNANYEYNGNKRTFEGYSVYNGVQVHLRDSSKLGAVLDTLTSSGVNQIESISFTHNDWDNLVKEALRLSIADAKEKAQMLAKEAKRELGKIETIVEGGVDYTPPTPMMGQQMVSSKMAMSARAETPIQGGELEIVSAVKVVFQLD